MKQYKIPCTLEECFEELDRMLSDADKQTIFNLSNKNEAAELHFTLGRELRNRWKLNDGNSPLMRYFATKNDFIITHPDEVSGIILEKYYEYLHNKSSHTTRSFREQVQDIAHSSKSLEERINELKALGLTKSDIQELLYQEIYKKENAEEKARLKRRTENINKRLAEGGGKTNHSGHMKCLAIRQPWATLIAAGIKDVECRENMIPPCKRFLIAASSTRAAKRLDEVLGGDLLDEVNGYIARGVLPPYEQWTTGAIIGYGDIEDVTYEDVHSPWAEGHDGIKYIIKNAHMMDAPIYGKNKATPFFYNVDGYDDDHLPPAHVVDLK